ncbi:TorF family putative porin [Massilia sp. S19_KUP03_FR1]|uniref:TorF family putative porin n=1 Tax=Massilia sp. S19_KUP03_FR1 TaxID=3025503 RepID=UPI002FCDBDAD
MLLWFAVSGSAHSQTSFDLTLASQYAARGAALSTAPVLQLRAEHDAQSERYAGWYAGAFGSPILVEGRTQGELVAYAGRAQRISSTLSWDVGASRTTFLRDGGANYHEFYAGLAMRRGSVRVFYSPAYYGEGRNAYLDLNGAWPLGENLHVTAHAGLLHPFGDYPGAAAGSDLRIALGTQVGDVSLEAGWQVKAHAYMEGGKPAPALSASASLRF